MAFRHLYFIKATIFGTVQIQVGLLGETSKNSASVGPVEIQVGLLGKKNSTGALAARRSRSRALQPPLAPVLGSNPLALRVQLPPIQEIQGTLGEALVSL